MYQCFSHWMLKILSQSVDNSYLHCWNDCYMLVSRSIFKLVGFRGMRRMRRGGGWGGWGRWWSWGKGGAPNKVIQNFDRNIANCTEGKCLKDTQIFEIKVIFCIAAINCNHSSDHLSTLALDGWGRSKFTAPYIDNFVLVAPLTLPGTSQSNDRPVQNHLSFETRQMTQCWPVVPFWQWCDNIHTRRKCWQCW